LELIQITTEASLRYQRSQIVLFKICLLDSKRLLTSNLLRL